MYRAIGMDRGVSRVEVIALGQRCSFDRAMKTANEMRETHEITAVFEDTEFVVGVNGTQEDTDEMMKRAQETLLRTIDMVKTKPLYFCAKCMMVGISPTSHRCMDPMVTLTAEQKVVYVEHGIDALK